MTPLEAEDGPVDAAATGRERSALVGVFGYVTVAACLIFVGTAGYEAFQVFHPESCSSMGDELAPGLTELPELQLHPPHATPQGTPTWDCDPDHDVEDWYVAQRFETAEDPIETSAYYRRALSSAGWIAVKAPPRTTSAPERTPTPALAAACGEQHEVH